MTDARQVVAEATQRLQDAGVPSATADARWLVSHVLGTSPAGLLFAGPLTADELDVIESAVTRRIAREPLQHILGTAPFGDLDLAVGPGVFVPRPETEVMAQYALTWLADLGRPATVVDACSGSGALALGIACHLPATVTAIEASPDAVVWLERNVERSGAAVRTPRFDGHGRRRGRDRPGNCGRHRGRRIWWSPTRPTSLTAASRATRRSATTIPPWRCLAARTASMWSAP